MYIYICSRSPSRTSCTWFFQILVHVVAGVIIVVIFGQLSVSVLLDPLKPVGFLRLLVVLVLAKVYAIVFLIYLFIFHFSSGIKKQLHARTPLLVLRIWIDPVEQII